MSKPAFINTAETICQKTNEAQLAAFEQSATLAKKALGANAANAISEKEQQQAVVKASLSKVPQEVKELEGLPLPEGSEDEAEAIIQGIKDAAGEVPQNAAFKELEATFAPVNAKAAKFGFETCAVAP